MGLAGWLANASERKRTHPGRVDRRSGARAAQKFWRPGPAECNPALPLCLVGAEVDARGAASRPVHDAREACDIEGRRLGGIAVAVQVQGKHSVARPVSD